VNKQYVPFLSKQRHTSPTHWVKTIHCRQRHWSRSVTVGIGKMNVFRIYRITMTFKPNTATGQTDDTNQQHHGLKRSGVARSYNFPTEGDAC